MPFYKALVMMEFLAQCFHVAWVGPVDLLVASNHSGNINVRNSCCGSWNMDVIAIDLNRLYAPIDILPLLKVEKILCNNEMCHRLILLPGEVEVDAVGDESDCGK